MSLNPPQTYRKTRNIHRRGPAAARPLAGNVLSGTLYFSTDTGVTERSNGVTWETYSGSGSTATTVIRETPSGAMNGVNVTFVLAHTPIAGSEEVYLNGLLQEPGGGNDYTIAGATITYLVAPIVTDRLRVSYRY